MDWILEHRIPAPLARVEAVLLEPATLAAVPRYLGSVEEVRPLARREGAGWIERSAWFRPHITLPASAPPLHPSMLEWEERTRWDRGLHRATFTILPNLPARLKRRVSCGGRYILEDLGDGATRRRVEGRITIDAPLIGRAAERFVVRLIRQQFDGEAAMLTALAA